MGIKFEAALFNSAKLRSPMHNSCNPCSRSGGAKPANVTRATNSCKASLSTKRSMPASSAFCIRQCASEFLDHQLVVKQRAHRVHAIRQAVPLQVGGFAHAVRKQLDQPFRLDARGHAN